MPDALGLPKKQKGLDGWGDKWNWQKGLCPWKSVSGDRRDVELNGRLKMAFAPRDKY